MDSKQGLAGWLLERGGNMGKRDNFTAERVAGFKCEPGKQQTIYWDGKTPGLGLRVTAKGAKSYIFERSLRDKSIRMMIGSPDVWPLESQWRKDAVTGERVLHCLGARDKAHQYSVLINDGVDPREQAQDNLEASQAARAEKIAAAEAAQAEAKRQSVTLGDLWPIYIEARKPNWNALHLRDNVRVVAKGGEVRKRSKQKTVAGPLASLLDLPLSALDAEAVEGWLRKESATRPTAAALSYRLLKAFIRWTEGEKNYKGIVPTGAYAAQRVREAVASPQTKEGDCLEREQLPAWFAGVGKIDSPVISAYLQGLLITGARREELATLKWGDVDFRWRSLTLKDKVEGKRKIPLTPYLASLLRELQRINDTPPNKRQLNRMAEQGKEWKPSQWVFFSKTAESGHITEPRPAHVEMLADEGLPHLSLHGLRRSFGTLCEWVEVPSGISAQIMGHKPSAIAEKHYRRRPLDLLRKWHDRIEAWMLEQAGIVYKVQQPGELSLAASN